MLIHCIYTNPSANVSVRREMEIGSTFMNNTGELNLFKQHQQLQHCGAELTHGQMRSLFRDFLTNYIHLEWVVLYMQNLFKGHRLYVQL